MKRKFKSRTILDFGVILTMKSIFFLFGVLVLYAGCTTPKEGIIIEFYTSGEIKQKKIYKNGLPNGPFTRYQETAEIVAEGFYKDGKIDGPYISYHKSGNISAKGTYDQGRKNGIWWTNDLDFDNYTRGKKVNWIRGKPNGPIIEHYRWVEKYSKVVKTYKNARRHGVWIYYDAAGVEDRYEVWEHGKRVRVGNYKEER